jgi:hypothetical protein
VPDVSKGPAEIPTEVINSMPELAEPPHLPMGWIIGALFIVALLLTLWIARRAGVFGSSAIEVPQLDPMTTTTPPRMP